MFCSTEQKGQHNYRYEISFNDNYFSCTIDLHLKKFTEVFPMMPFSKSTHMVCSIPLPVPLPQNYKIAKKCFALLNKRANITTDTKYLLTTITSHVPLNNIKKSSQKYFP